MKKLYTIIGIITGMFISVGLTANAASVLFPYQGGTGIGSAVVGNVGNCLKVSDDSPFTYELGTCGGGSGGGTWSTTTTSGYLLNYSNNATDAVAIGSNSTTTAEWWYDPNTAIGYIQGKLGIGTTSPSKALDVNGDALINGVTVGKGANSVTRNTAFGENALSSVTTGPNNTAFGFNALSLATTADDNAAFGMWALENLTIGTDNVAMGNQTLQNLTTGEANTAVGWRSMNGLTTGQLNVGVGRFALQNITDANNNTAIGYDAGRLNNGGAAHTSGNSSIFIGADARPSGNVNNEIVIGAGAVGQGASTTVMGSVGHTLNRLFGRLQLSTSIASSSIPAAGIIDNSVSQYLSNTNADHGLLTGVLDSGTAWLQAQRTDATATTYNLLFNPNGGNVGIGNTTANEVLEARQNNVGGDTSLLVVNSAATGGTTETAELKFALANNVDRIAKIVAKREGTFSSAGTANSSLRFYNSLAGTPTEQLTILSNGNVGIGTTSPYSKLSVAGRIVGQNFVATSTTATSTFAGAIQVPTGAEGSPSIVFDNEANTGFHLQSTGVIDVNVPNQFRVDINNSSTIYDFQSTQFLPAPNSTNKLGAFGNAWNGVFASSTSYMDKVNIATSTAPQLTLADREGSTPYNIRAVGTHLYVSTSSPTTGATTTTPILDINSTGPAALAVGTSTETYSGVVNGMLFLGSNGVTGSTTMVTGKYQRESKNTDGTTICSFIVGTTPVTITGACNK